MRSRTIYAHWLDPVYLGARLLGGSVAEQRRLEFEGILKMHAVLGDSMSLSDVQLIESALVLRLFSDPEFRAFTAAHPDFIRLVAKPSPLVETGSERTSSVSSGLARIKDLGEAYFSDTFYSRNTMLHVVDLFRGIRNEKDLENIFSPRGRFSQFVNEYAQEDKPLLSGLFHCLAHFFFNQNVPVTTPRARQKSTSYHQELEKVYEALDAGQVDLKETLGGTLKLANTTKEKYKRTLVTHKLPNATEIGHPDRTKYLLIIQAWNVAVSRTIGADTDSAYCFRQAFPIPVYAGTTTQCTTLVTRVASEDEPSLTFAQFGWHPSTLRWATLSKIRKECSKEIAEFQDAIHGVGSEGDQDTISAKLELLGQSTGRIISQEGYGMPSPPTWLVSACGAAGYGVSVGAALLGYHTVAVAAGSPTGLFHTYSLLASALRRQNAREIGEAIQTYAFQYNMHRRG